MIFDKILQPYVDNPQKFITDKLKVDVLMMMENDRDFQLKLMEAIVTQEIDYHDLKNSLEAVPVDEKDRDAQIRKRKLKVLENGKALFDKAMQSKVKQKPKTTTAPPVKPKPKTTTAPPVKPKRPWGSGSPPHSPPKVVRVPAGGRTDEKVKVGFDSRVNVSELKGSDEAGGSHYHYDPNMKLSYERTLEQMKTLRESSDTPSTDEDTLKNAKRRSASYAEYVKKPLQEKLSEITLNKAANYIEETPFDELPITILQQIGRVTKWDKSAPYDPNADTEEEDVRNTKRTAAEGVEVAELDVQTLKDMPNLQVDYVKFSYNKESGNYGITISYDAPKLENESYVIQIELAPDDIKKMADSFAYGNKMDKELEHYYRKPPQKPPKPTK